MTSTQRNNFGTFTAAAVTFGDNSPAVAGGGADPSRPQPSAGGCSRVLLVVVADVERDATIRAVTAVSGASLTRSHSRHHTIYSLGRIGRTEVTLAQVAQGTTTPDAAGVAMPALLDDVKPHFVLAVGICYGLKADDPRRPQQLGDVLIATQLRLAAHRKVAGTETDRGGAVHPSAVLLDRLRSARLDWRNEAAVHEGPIVTESVLVDSAAYQQRIRRLYPEAIGGEMEGAGVYAAAIRSKVDWALVKGICDWGFDKDDRHQAPAAANAASFVTHMIRIGGLDPIPSP
ncbi:nucleoside phosphorylase [Allocatelliglobosispora scoriae]|uniref:Nucleoside phosphorylase n=1 Tax=Allocatelliglobosispora scoriae TaxID=643052 RepID=A0A841BZ93_9ACTN|nr:hypothetical protein [Allocatelliglobosispora scoriae]MBB5873454.1 nucleoside phosphorylase [Allocatelliglobosispora scoriae]